MAQDAAAGALRLLVEMQRRADFPLTATIELTRRCNLRCEHCFLDLDGHSGLPTERLERLIDELAEAGALFLTFTGGEPTLHPGWRSLLARAKARGFAVRLKTNAARLKDDDVRFLADLPVLSVDVSVYSASGPGPHEAITASPGSWERTVGAVRRLREAGARVTVAVPVTSVNAREVEPVARWATELGCDLSIDPRIQASFDAERDTAPLVSDQETFDDAVAVARRHGLVSASRPDEPRGVSDPWPCLTTEAGLYVRADGEVRRCAALDVSFGSVLDQPIRDLWTSSPARRALLERATVVPSRCTACEVAWACHRCPAHALAEHGDLWNSAEIDCRLARARSKSVLVDKGARCDTSGCAPHLPAATRRRVEGESGEPGAKGFDEGGRE